LSIDTFLSYIDASKHLHLIPMKKQMISKYLRIVYFVVLIKRNR
jgi:hypothetical protein